MMDTTYHCATDIAVRVRQIITTYKQPQHCMGRIRVRNYNKKERNMHRVVADPSGFQQDEVSACDSNAHPATGQKHHNSLTLAMLQKNGQRKYIMVHISQSALSRSMVPYLVPHPAGQHHQQALDPRLPFLKLLHFI